MNCFRWRGRVLRSWALSPSPPNICKPLLVSPFPPPVVTTSALSIEESEEGAIARRGKSGTNGRRTDGRTDRHVRKRFLVDAVSNEDCHRSWCARSGRKQVSGSKRNHRTIIGIRPISAGTSLLRGSASLCFFFAYTIYSRIGRTRTLAIIHSAMIRARVTFSNLFLDRLCDYPSFSLILAFAISRSLTLFLPSSLSLSLLFPASINIHYPRVSRIFYSMYIRVCTNRRGAEP